MSILTAIGMIIAVSFLLPLFTGRKVLNIGNITGVILAAMLVYAGINPAVLDTAAAKAVMAVLVLCLIPVIYFTAAMIRTCRKRPEGSETLIILGCEIIGENPSLMQVERLQAGLKYLQASRDACVICSGGQGDNEIMSEAYAMGRWLKNRGIEESRILLEDTSRTTVENIRNSKKLMDFGPLFQKNVPTLLQTRKKVKRGDGKGRRPRRGRLRTVRTARSASPRPRTAGCRAAGNSRPGPAARGACPARRSSRFSRPGCSRRSGPWTGGAR